MSMIKVSAVNVDTSMNLLSVLPLAKHAKCAREKNTLVAFARTKKLKESFRKMERSVNKIEREESQMFIGALGSKNNGKKKMTQTEKRSNHRNKEGKNGLQ